MTKLCLNAIVKDESARVQRWIESLVPFLDYYVVVDTGSTDGTQAKIKELMDYYKVPGELHEAPFHDWSQARNAALAHARAAWCKDPTLFDYMLLVDADMQLIVKDRSCFDGLDGPSYDMMQHAGSVHYLNRRLLKASETGQYLGVTHEYLNVVAAGEIPEAKAFFLDHADGANRPEKFKRDIRLLKQGLRDEPHNERYMFYLANSFRDAGETRQALHWYQRRVAAGGWDEEVWQAQLNIAHCRLTLGDEGGFLREALTAYNLRPQRAEPLFDLAHYYREKGMNAVGAAFAEVGMSIPKPNDALFVNDFAHTAGLAEEFSICGFYVPAKRQRASEVTDRLALLPTPYQHARHTARANTFWYLQPLKSFCPSFTCKKIDFTPPDGWVAMNPSVTNNVCCLSCIVRTVNYTITENGRYIIKEVLDDGTTGCNANAENPINTRNWLVSLSDGLSTIGAEEVLPPGNFPKKWPLVVGFEDMRLFPFGEDLWFSATARQFHADGNCEQVRGRLTFSADACRVADDYVRMLRTPRETEKNWAPVVTDDVLRFIHRPGEVVDDTGDTFAKFAVNFDTSTISGGSPLVEWRAGGGWIALVHEASVLPNGGRRYYWHRFIYYDLDLRPRGISTPFVFLDRQIEFAAGMCWHPDRRRLVISFGVNDAEAYVGTIEAADIERAFPWPK